MQKIVDSINGQFPVDALWNGYKIRMFKRKNLVVGGSQDWMYFHNIDVIFKKVIFFNLPSGWHDTSVHGDDLFRLSTKEEFQKHHPDFEVGSYHVFAFDLYKGFEAEAPTTFFVVANNVFFERLQNPAGDGIVDYEDPLEDIDYYSRENRIKCL
jgi:hypothetical protein